MENIASKFKYGLNIFFSEKELASPLEKKALPVVSGCAEVLPHPSGDGVHLHVSSKDADDAPIIISLSGSTKALISVDANVKATIIEQGSAGVFNVELVLAPGAEVKYVSLRAGGTELSQRRATLMDGAQLTWASAHLAAKFGYDRTTTDLVGRGAGVKERSLFLGDGSDRFDIYSEVRHLANATTSDLLTRGALGGSSKAIVRGLVKIKEGMRACVGRQKEDTLLISPTAEIDAVPMLEIAAADVRCSHSSSSGRLDDEKLFYLMSRGLSREKAAQAMIQGFFAPVMSEFDAITAAKILAEISLI